MRLDTDFFKHVLHGAQCWGEFPKNGTFSIDTRTIEPGQVFVALAGKQVNGHEFILDAVEKGAAGVIVQKGYEKYIEAISSERQKDLFVALVADTKQALLKLAGAWRSQFDYPVIGITGSLGKTSTKEILAHILKTAGYSFYASRANENTLLGAALNILRMRSEHKVALFEMGISARNEMPLLADLIRPTSALITTIAHSHISGLGSLADIAQEKRHIFSCFKEGNIGIINGDVPVLNTISYSHPMIRFGLKTTNQIQARKVKITSDSIQFTLKIYKERYTVQLPTNHQGRVINSLAAVSVAHMLGISGDTIAKALQVPLIIDNRFQALSLKAGGSVISDCYNANPESMKAALLAFEKIEAKSKKIAILGDMLELGVMSPFWHKQVGRLLGKLSSLDYVILVGNETAVIPSMLPHTLPHSHVATWQEVVDVIQKHLDQEPLILVKSSFGMHLTKLVKQLTQ